MESCPLLKQPLNIIHYHAFGHSDTPSGCFTVSSMKVCGHIFWNNTYSPLNSQVWRSKGLNLVTHKILQCVSWNLNDSLDLNLLHFKDPYLYLRLFNCEIKFQKLRGKDTKLHIINSCSNYSSCQLLNFKCFGTINN